MTGTIFQELTYGYQRMRAVSEAERLAIHRTFAAFYNSDYLLINDILKKSTLNNPFSQETLDKMNFQHIDQTKKVLNRLSAGIYTNEAQRELIIGKDKTDENLPPLLKKLRYSAKVKDSFRKALYYNLILVQPVYDMQLNRMRLDIITPDMVTKLTTKDDYLEIEEIGIEKARPDGTVYESVWNETEHYNIEGDEKVFYPDKNQNGKNPLKKIPFIILRMNEGIDFWGEPNWNLLLNQINYDIRLTDLNEAELRTVYQFFVGYNTDFKDFDRFAPGQLRQVIDSVDSPARIESIQADIDFASVKDNIDWKMKQVMSSEGLSAQSGDTDVANESGVKRMIDEIELQERRDEFKETLYNFEINLLDMIRTVNNYYQMPKLSDTGFFEVTFSEEKATERIEDKVARREMEAAIGYKDEIDFTMEDLEVSEEDAVTILTDRKTRVYDLGVKDKNDNTEDNKTEPEAQI